MVNITDSVTHITINNNGVVNTIPKNLAFVNATETGTISIFYGDKLIVTDIWTNYSPGGVDINATVSAITTLLNTTPFNGIAINSLGSYTDIIFNGYVSVFGNTVTINSQQITLDGVVYIGNKTGSLQTGTAQEPFSSINAAIAYLDTLPLQNQYTIISLGGIFQDTNPIVIPDKMQNFAIIGVGKQVFNFVQAPKLIIDNTLNNKNIVLTDLYFQFSTMSGASIEETGNMDIALNMQGCNIEHHPLVDTFAINSFILLVYVLGYIANFNCTITDTKPFASFIIFNNNIPDGNVSIAAVTQPFIFGYVQNASFGGGVNLTLQEAISFIQSSALKDFTHLGITTIPGAIAAIMQNTTFQEISIPFGLTLKDITLTNGGYRLDNCVYNNFTPNAATLL